MSRIRKTKPNLPKVQAGDCVLLGTYATTPWGWWHGQVLHVHGEQLFLLRRTQNGNEYTQESTIYDVRAVGTMAQLSEIQRAAAEELKPLTVAVHEAEAMLSLARNRMHEKLQQLSERGIAVTPYDKESADESEKQERAVMETLEQEQLDFEAKAIGGAS